MGVTDMEQARRRQLERHSRQRSIESLHGAAAWPATRERARTLHYVQQRQSLLPRRTPRRQRIAALDYGRAVLIGAVDAASHPDLVGRAGMFEEQHELFRRNAPREPRRDKRPTSRHFLSTGPAYSRLDYANATRAITRGRAPGGLPVAVSPLSLTPTHGELGRRITYTCDYRK